MKAQLVPKTNRRIKKSRKALLSKEKNFYKGKSKTRKTAGESRQKFKILNPKSVS